MKNNNTLRRRVASEDSKESNESSLLLSKKFNLQEEEGKIQSKGNNEDFNDDDDDDGIDEEVEEMEDDDQYTFLLEKDSIWASDEDERQEGLALDPDYDHPMAILRRRKRRYKEVIEDTRNHMHDKSVSARNMDYVQLLFFLVVWSFIVFGLWKYSPWGHLIEKAMLPILALLSIPLAGVLVMFYVETKQQVF